MKIVNVSNRKFENSNDIKLLIEEQGYKNFEIGEAPLLYGEEIPVEDNSIDLDSEYLCHTGILNDDDSVFYSLITTGYDDDVNKRYRPIMFIKDDQESCNWQILVKFEE